MHMYLKNVYKVNKLVLIYELWPFEDDEVTLRTLWYLYHAKNIIARDSEPIWIYMLTA